MSQYIIAANDQRTGQEHITYLLMGNTGLSGYQLMRNALYNGLYKLNIFIFY